MPTPKAYRITLGERGPHVERLQRQLNRTLKGAKLGWLRPQVDGHAGKLTFRAARHAAGWQGLSTEQQKVIGNEDEITRHIYAVLCHDKPRTPAMKKRARRRRKHFARLRREHHNSPRTKDGLALFDDEIQRNSPSGPVWVAAWMLGEAEGPDGTRTNWLARARREGWTGYLTSGHRDPAYSESLCLAMCGAPSCPGRCAGRASNHAQKGPPNWGAIDATDYVNLGRIFQRIGAPLRNALGPADPVHFSPSGV